MRTINCEDCGKTVLAMEAWTAHGEWDGCIDCGQTMSARREAMYWLRHAAPDVSLEIMEGTGDLFQATAQAPWFGRRRIRITEGLCVLSARELIAIIAHELAHIGLQHHWQLDCVLISVVGWVILPILAWSDSQSVIQVLPVLLISVLVFTWAIVYRRRMEYQADKWAANLLRDPAPLINALHHLAFYQNRGLTPWRVFYPSIESRCLWLMRLEYDFHTGTLEYI